MSRSFRALLAAAAVVTIVAACGASASPSPSTPASAAPSGGAPASASPSFAPGSSPTPEPSVDRHGAPELEERLADAVGGTTLSKVSLTGADFVALGTDTGRQQIAILLGELGRTIGDLSVAQASDPSGSLPFQEGLFRVAGADPVELLAQWVASQQAATGNRLQVSNTTVAGRALTQLTDPSFEVGGTTYAFADGDTLWLMAADDPALLEEALGKIG